MMSDNSRESCSQSGPTGWQDLLDRVEAIISECKVEKKIVVSNEMKENILGLLSGYTANFDDYKQFVHYDSSGYTKNLVKYLANDSANVIVMCWAPGQSSAIHAHEGSQCFVKVLLGQLLEEQVDYPGSSSKVRVQVNDDQPGVGGRRCLAANDVTYIDDTIGCHRVSNTDSNKPAITLHFYVPPYEKCRIFEIISETSDDRGGEFIALSRSKTVDVTFSIS